jgi:hypothetical protein
VPLLAVGNTAVRYLTEHPTGEPTEEDEPPGTEPTDEEEKREEEKREEQIEERAGNAPPPGSVGEETTHSRSSHAADG